MPVLQDPLHTPAGHAAGTEDHMTPALTLLQHTLAAAEPRPADDAVVALRRQLAHALGGMKLIAEPRKYRNGRLGYGISTSGKGVGQGAHVDFAVYIVGQQHVIVHMFGDVYGIPVKSPKPLSDVVAIYKATRSLRERINELRGMEYEALETFQNHIQQHGMNIDVIGDGTLHVDVGGDLTMEHTGTFSPDFKP